jgi:hypothetical protein
MLAMVAFPIPGAILFLLAGPFIHQEYALAFVLTTFYLVMKHMRPKWFA